MPLFCALLPLFLASGGESIRIAIMPLAPRSIQESLAETVTDFLAGQLTSQEGVRVMERSEMKRILQEQGFQKSGACDGRKCAVEVGRILGIDQMVVGAFGRLGDSWFLTARRVSVESGEIVAQSTRQYEGPLEKVPDHLVAAVVADLSGVGWAPPLAESAKASPKPPTASVPSRKIEVDPEARVPIRIRHASDTAGSWVYVEDGSTRRFLGKTPLDTSLTLRNNVFVVATVPGVGGASIRNWLIGPTDSGETGWRDVERAEALQKQTQTTSVDTFRSELGTWKTYKEDKVDSGRAKLGATVRTGGVVMLVMGGTLALLAGSALAAAASDSVEQPEDERENTQKILLVGVGAMGVGITLALVGQGILDAAGVGRRAAISFQPLDGLGATGRASGVAIAARF